LLFLRLLLLAQHNYRVTWSRAMTPTRNLPGSGFFNDGTATQQASRFYTM
jgi:hypothetical protein